MNTLQTQLKAVVIMLVLVLGLTVFERADSIAAFLDNEQHTANIFNPVATFLGIPTGNNDRGPNYDSLQTREPVGSQDNDGDRYFLSTPDDPFGDNGGSFVNTPAPGRGNPNTEFVGGSTGGSVSQGGAPRSISNRPPELLCVPGIINEGEEALIMWACRDEAYMSVSETIDTESKTVGAMRVHPTEDTTYDIICINDIPEVDDTAASCTIEVAQPALALIATPSSAARGNNVTLSWKTVDTAECVLSSSEHPAFTRRGTEGDASSPALYEDTIFTLMCETAAGTLEERDIEVHVD